MKYLIFFFVLGATNTVFGKTLECRDKTTFLNHRFSVDQNEGSIDATLSAGLGIWNSGGMTFLSALTGRPSDSEFKLKELRLIINSKGVCSDLHGATNNFKCAAPKVTVIATGEKFREDTSGGLEIFDRVSMQSQFAADIEVEMSTIQGRLGESVHLKGTLNTHSKPLDFSVFIYNKAKECLVTN